MQKEIMKLKIKLYNHKFAITYFILKLYPHSFAWFMNKSTLNIPHTESLMAFVKWANYLYNQGDDQWQSTC